MLHNFGRDFPLPLVSASADRVEVLRISLRQRRSCAQAYRSWMWRICRSLSLSHFRYFQTDLGVSAGWAAQRRFIFIIRWRSFTATLVWLRLASLTWFVLHQPLDLWQRLFFSGLWWNSLQLHDSSAIHIITGQKRHLSRWRNSTHTHVIYCFDWSWLMKTSVGLIYCIYTTYFIFISCCRCIFPGSAFRFCMLLLCAPFRLPIMPVWSSAFWSETHQPPVGSPLFRTPGGEVRTLSIT